MMSRGPKSSDNACGRRDFLRFGAFAAVAGALGASADAAAPVERGKPPRIKLSCCAYSYRQFLSGSDKTMTLEDFVETCAEMGLDGVELTTYYWESREPAYVNRLKRTCFLLGMDVSGTAVGNNFCVPPGAGRDKQVAAVKRWIDCAAELGAPVMRVFAGRAPRGVTEDEARGWVGQCLEECARHAAERGVMLALENHGGVTTTAEGLLAIVKQVESDWVGVNLDTGNFRSPDPYADIEKAAPYALNCHAKTNVHPVGRSASEADFGRIVDILRSVGYRGYISIEYEAREDPRTGVPKFAEKIRAALAADRGR